MKDLDNPFQLKSSKWRMAGMGLILLIVLLQWSRPMILPSESQIRQAFHRAVQARFPEPALNLANRMGIHPFGGEWQTGDQSARGRVVLIHGLDDPGIMWKDLGPVLQANQYQVLVMSYPNDQAIQASSRFFFDHMRNLAERPGSGQHCGPFHGRAGGQGHADPTGFGFLRGSGRRRGAGGQAIDSAGNSQPGSASGPVPDCHRDPGSDLSPVCPEIALASLPYGRDRGGRCGSAARKPVPDPVESAADSGGCANDHHCRHDFFSERPSGLKEMMGDGLVSVNATRLGQVPVIRVPGTHFSMIRNLIRTSSRMPPAIPVILKLLESSGKDTTH